MTKELFSKPTLGFFELASCKGCEQQILNADHDLLDVLRQVDVVYWESLSSKEVPLTLDIAIVEGAVSTSEQAEFVRALRESAKVVIAIGACACGLGGSQNGAEQAFVPVSDVIKVDNFVRCCPIDTNKFINVLQSAISGRNTFESTATLCGECKSNEKGCFFGRGHVCCGLLSRCGCDALCTKMNAPCRGCSGISPNACLETAKSVAMEVTKSGNATEFEDLLSVCTLDKFLSKNLGDLKGEDAAFVASRFDGQNSAICALCALETTEKEMSIKVSEKDKNLRECLRLATRAQNHVSSLVFEDLRKIKGYADFLEFAEAEPEFTEKALDLRHSFTFALQQIGGRAVHPITPKLGGFSVEVSKSTCKAVLRDLKQTENFAVELIDVFASCWEKSCLGADASALARVLDGWDELSDAARFGAAKASLRPPEADTRKECIARAIEIVDALERMKDLMQRA